MALPPHSARMPSRPWRVAACMALSPSLVSTRSDLPSGWMKVMAGIKTPRQAGVMVTGRLSSPRSVLLKRRFGSPVISILAMRRASAVSITSPSRRAHKLADAHVDARAEADVAGGATRDVVAVRLVPAPADRDWRQRGTSAPSHPRRCVSTAELDLARGGSEEGLHRTFEAHRLLEGVAGERVIVAQPLPLVGEAGEAIDGSTDAVDGRIEAGRQQRAHQERRLCGGDLAVVDPGMDAGTKPAGRQVVALALFGNIGLMRRRTLDRVLSELVGRAEGVEHQRSHRE